MKCHLLWPLLAIISLCLSSSWATGGNRTTPAIESSASDNNTTRAPVTEESRPEEDYEWCRGEWRYPHNCVGFSCDYKTTWEYLDDNDEIVFTVSTKNRNKWTGIGFSNNQAMPDTDAILGLVEESGRFFMMDTYFEAYEAPPLDSEQNIHNMTATRENGITTLKFFRKRLTGDPKDFQFTDTNCPYFIFPVMGGLFNAVNKRIRKHETTPIISDNKICVRSCKVAVQTTSTSTTTSPVNPSDAEEPESDVEMDNDYKDLEEKSQPTTTVIPQQSTTKPKDNNVNPLKWFNVEVKLPHSWRPALGQRHSDEYQNLMQNVKKHMNSELNNHYQLVKRLEVVELTGVQEESNSVIAKMEMAVDDETGDQSKEKNKEVPASLKKALQATIKNSILGDLKVDPKYLVIRRSEGILGDESNQIFDSKWNWDNILSGKFLNDEQMKWIIIIGGVAALVLLVLIQACCMIWKDNNNKERKPVKDKPATNSHWKDYAASNAMTTTYGYENFGADETDNCVKSNMSNGNGHGNGTGKVARQGKPAHQHQQQQYLKSEKIPYQSATLERSLSRDNPALRYPSVYATQDRRDARQSPFAQPLQPDFYFMPHQRRYSGEVVRVFVDYNNPQYIPK